MKKEIMKENIQRLPQESNINIFPIVRQESSLLKYSI